MVGTILFWSSGAAALFGALTILIGGMRWVASKRAKDPKAGSRATVLILIGIAILLVLAVAWALTFRGGERLGDVAS